MSFPFCGIFAEETFVFSKRHRPPQVMEGGLRFWVRPAAGQKSESEREAGVGQKKGT